MHTVYENAQVYNYFRDYDPTTGRYIQSDPIGLAGGFNTYVYAASNPIGNIDILGLWSFGAEFYRGFGGGMVFGQNPDGSWFGGPRWGAGFGGGINFDPYGTAPDWNDECDGSSTAVGAYGQAGFNVGPFGVGGGVSGGYSTGSGFYSGFTGPAASYGDNGGVGLSFGASAGVEAVVTSPVGPWQ